MKAIQFIISLILTYMILNGSGCKKEHVKSDQVPGSYSLKRTGYSYWCDRYQLTSGKDTTDYLGYYSYMSQPENLPVTTAVISKGQNGEYSICLEGSCSSDQFNSGLNFIKDSVDFGSGFLVFDTYHTVLKMTGVKTESGFKGIYTEYANQGLPTSSNPHSHIFIGTFELVKK